MNKRTIPANITATLAVGSTATAPYYDVNITQQLCTPACGDETPVFTPHILGKEHRKSGCIAVSCSAPCGGCYQLYSV